MVNKVQKPDGELDFLAKIFAKDNKNYHAWQYRIWLCQKFNLYAEELVNVQALIKQDIKNNSAWNFRFFLFQTHKYKSVDDVHAEIKYTMEKIEECPENESSWNYLSGFFKMYEFKCLRSGEAKKEGQTHSHSLCEHDYKDFPEIWIFCQKFSQTNKSNRFLLSVMIQILIAQNTQDSLKQALQCVKELAHVSDVIRQNYWLWFAENLCADFSELLAQTK